MRLLVRNYKKLNKSSADLKLDWNKSFQGTRNMFHSGLYIRTCTLVAANHDLGRKSLISTKLQQIRHFVKRTVPPFGISLKINFKKKTRLNKPLADIYCDKCPEFS